MSNRRQPIWASPRKTIIDTILSILRTALCIAIAVLMMTLCWQIWTILRLVGAAVPDPLTLLVAGAILALMSIVLMPKLQVSFIKFSSPFDRFTAENEARKTLAAIVAGLAIFISFYTAQRQLGLQQEGQFTDRYTKAIDQLAASDTEGTPRLAVRLGGIYALEQIMNSSEEHHFSILEVLCLYIRENSLQSILKPKDRPRGDVRAALTALGKRRREVETAEQAKSGWRALKEMLLHRDLLRAIAVGLVRPTLDLSGSDLGGASLDGLILSGADFSEARLSGCTAQLADLEGARFDNADLSGCVIASRLVGASFHNANLERAFISGTVSNGSLQGAKVALSCWVGTEFENPREIRSADGWEDAFYADRDLAILGLPRDHNLKLTRLLVARYPALPPEGRLGLVKVFEALRRMAGLEGELVKELSKPFPKK